MIKKDYIQRYLDELTKMIAVVLQLKQNNEPELADIKIDEFANNFLNINLNEMIKESNPTLIETLLSKHHFELTHFKLLEELLYQKYLLTPFNTNLKNITLEVLNYLLKVDRDFSVERQNRVQELS